MAFGIMGGAPLSVSGVGNGGDHCLMKCCKKKVEQQNKTQTHRPNFCRITACSESIPAVPGSSASAAAISPFAGEKAGTAFQFVTSVRPRAPGSIFEKTSPELAGLPPVFILHHSLLI